MKWARHAERMLLENLKERDHFDMGAGRVEHARHLSPLPTLDFWKMSTLKDSYQILIDRSKINIKN
jgi:hypothetical protein